MDQQKNKVQKSRNRKFSLPSGTVLRVTTSDGAVFDVAQLQTDRNFRYISGWSLPIFELSTRYPTSLLSRVGKFGRNIMKIDGFSVVIYDIS